jgi:hypothetical protein
MNAFKSFFTIIILMAITISPASADTLVLKSGERVTGSFEGGTAHVVKFRTSDGGVKEYDVVSIQQIQFSSEQTTAALPTTSANTAHTFPAGSKITIRMIDSISGEKQTAGSLFVARLEEPMMVGVVEVIPKGADVWGRVTGSDPMRLELTQIFVNGIPYSIATAEYHAAQVIPSETKLEFTLKQPLVIGAREEF